MGHFDRFFPIESKSGNNNSKSAIFFWKNSVNCARKRVFGNFHKIQHLNLVY